MKRALLSAIFILVGSGTWWALSQSARFSFRKWDVKFDTAVRHGLNDIGLKDADIISSFNEIIESENGDVVIRQLTVKSISKKDRARLIENLKRSGANVDISRENGDMLLKLRRGEREFHRIRIQNS